MNSAACYVAARKRLTAAAKEHSLSENQAVVLVVLMQTGTVKVGAACELVGCLPAQFTRSLGDLEQCGYLTRDFKPEDRRCVMVKLTPKGIETAAIFCRLLNK